MDEKHFDTMARSLAQLSSRRRVLGGLFATTLTLLAGSSAMAKRGTIRRGRRSSHGQAETATATDIQPDGILTGGVWEETLEMCHYDPETGGYRIVPVSTIAVPERLSQGDTVYIDCCASTDCTSTECLTAAGCVSGACNFHVAINAQCTLETGALGICRSDGVCVPVSS